MRFCYSYAVLLALRVACAFAPAYIHPDEWFQSGEVLAGTLAASACLGSDVL